jgi:PAS domain S-box-containing protein
MLQTVYLTLLAVTCILGVGIAYSAWTHREILGARPLILTCVAAVVWAGGSFGLVTVSTPIAELRWLQISYFGIVASPVGFVLLAVLYTGYVESFPTRAAAVLGGFAGGFLLLVWTNPSHHLYWARIDYSAPVPAGLSTTPGPGFLAFVVFTYVLLLFGSFLFLRYVVTAPNLYRRQSAMLIIAVAAPWAANIPHSLQLMTADFTPISLLVTVSAIWVAMFRYRLAEVGPVALRTVFENISSAVCVLDRHDRVVDINGAGMELFGVSEDVIGARFREIVPTTALADLVDGTGRIQEIIRIDDSESETRYYEVSVTPTNPGQGGRDSRVVVINDVTTLKLQQRRLAAQNERLDQFTSVISHDLRNPLNVAQGRLELAREECDSEHLTAAADAHARMDELIEDLLAMARGGRSVGDREAVSVEELATRAWATIESPEATIETDIERTIAADPSRLRQAFENLFRNAIEHGGGDVTITVGELPEGFYVEDDGNGIPESRLDQVFEEGFSTSDEGTGLGLNIVRQIVEAHEWQIRVKNGSRGGARFEITGVEFVGE